MEREAAGVGEEPLFGGFGQGGGTKLREEAPVIPEPEPEDVLEMRPFGPAVGGDDEPDGDEFEEVLEEEQECVPASIPPGAYRIKRGACAMALRLDDEGKQWQVVLSVKIRDAAEAIHGHEMRLPVVDLSDGADMTVVEVDGLAFLVSVDRLEPAGDA